MEQKIIQKFNSLLVKYPNKCWWWTGSIANNGHPIFQHRNPIIYARKISWEIKYGKLLEKKFIINTCNTFGCLNPDHMELSTSATKAIEWSKERFLENVNKTDYCWLWKGFLDKDGYGTVSYKGNRTRAHRKSYEIFIGPIDKNLCVCHRCDNPTCVNPDHLFLGTSFQNIQDKTNKNRQGKGESHGMSKILEKDVKDIIKKRKLGLTYKEISKQYNLSETNIYSIVNRKIWKHVEID